jgi:myo-inositol-1(or 4)-monophosphatase
VLFRSLFRVDIVIRTTLVTAFPDYNIYSEEGGDNNLGSEYSWVVDPLDGTIPYTFGISDHFSVSIALVKGKIPILGIVYAPQRGEMYVGEAGKGATCNDKPISVDLQKAANRALLAIDYGKRNRTKMLQYLDPLLSENGICYPVTYACASVALTFVASGRIHGYIAANLEPWDMAAAVAILKEAGASVTNIRGGEWQLGDNSIIAANPILHAKLLRLLRSAVNKNC